MATEGHCSVRLTRRYPEPPPEVGAALTEPGPLARWLRPGFVLPQTEVEAGGVLELARRPPGEEPSVVRIEVAPEGTGTILVLGHARIDARVGMQAMRFWVVALGLFPLEARA